jgi:HD-like signal output (HDOD) protein
MSAAIEIPTLPVAQIRAMSLISNPAPSFEELGSVVDADPALTAALLRAANSAISSPVDRVRTARVAMVRIGAAETRRIVMSIALSNSFGSIAESGIDEAEMWRHLIATGVLADATAWGEVRHSEAFTAGMLHDLGRLAMAAQDPLRYSKVVDMARRGIPATEGERTIFGMNHCQWGQSIGRAWGFPGEIVDAIGEHHTASQHGLSWVVTRARELAASLGIGDGLVPPEPPLPGTEAAMLPVVEELGGEEAVIARVEWYSGAFRAA